MFIRNCWYVAAWDHELLSDTLLPRTIIGDPVLLYRRADGMPVAIADRCCHRHAPLSMGRKEGDCVRCMYHGLKFDSSGRCVEIPGQESVPASMSVRTYPVVQRGRWVWVWMGDPGRADEALITDDFSIQHADWPYKPGYMHTAADYRLVCDNLLDFSHLSYVHEKTLGGSIDIAHTKPLVELMPRGLRVTRDIRHTVPAPYHARLGQFAGKVNRHLRYDFMVPGILLLQAHVKPDDTPDDDLRHALCLRSCQALTPETANSTHYFFMQAHNFRADDATVTEALYQSVVQAFEEDKRIIEAQQRLIDLGGAAAPPMKAIAADLALVQYRRLLDRLITEEQTTKETS